MGFTAGSDVRARPLFAAFTMVEVLLVIGMLVLIMGAAGLWLRRGLLTPEQRPPQEAFLAAAGQARVLAMQQGRPVLLTFDEQAQGFRLKVLDADTPGGQEAYSGSLPWDEGVRSSGFSTSRLSSGSPRLAAGGAPGGTDFAGSHAGVVADETDSGANGAGGGTAGSVARRVADARFFALPEGSRLRVRFYLMYGGEAVSLPQPLEGIRYHPSGVSTPVQVHMEDRGTSDFRLTLLPDNLSGGLRLETGGRR